MQMIISEIATTFVDDAVALAKGLAGLARDMTVGLFVAAWRGVLAPVDRLARACDVAGVLRARHAVMTRARVEGATWRRTSTPRPRRKRSGVCNVFRGLQDLT